MMGGGTFPMSLASFHPAVAAWFRDRLGEPTAPQARAWPSIRAGRHTLVAAPTGSGKTLAAFLAAIDELVRQGLAGTLADETRVVYVSPLKALSSDIHRNLEEPLGGIRAELAARALPAVDVRALTRTGDTPPAARAAMGRRPPHLLVTTPESLYLLLGSDGGRRVLRTARTVIVDEIHAVAGSKRGAHLALSLARLEALAGRPLLRVGLSATQRPIEEMARFLLGAGGVGPDGTPRCALVDAGHRRDLDLSVETPRSPLEAVMAGEVWDEVYDRLAELARGQRTTLIFVNTRRLAERVAKHLGDRLGVGRVAAHHGSLSRERRQEAERRLKAGDLRAIVATASLELGIDIGSVDLVCQVGSTRSIATLLQRAGRSGHALGRLPRCRVFPTSRDELVEAAALIDAARRGELEALSIPERPLDVLAQQLVAAVACEEWSEDGLFALVRRAWPYRNLPREEFDDVVRMVAGGFATRRGRRGALLHHDAVGRRLRPRRGARLAALTSGGAIPDSADYHVVLEPGGTSLGTIHEDFAIESMPGDIFQLGNASWRILRVEPGRVLVADARGAPPTIPFWLGEAPGRSPELSAAVSRLRAELDRRLGEGTDAAAAWLRAEVGLPPGAARQIADYLAAARAALGLLPTHETIVVERFFDEASDLHLVIHAPFGSRRNRAWGLALRKRLCRAFNFELQAAATEDAIVLSLGPTHSFPPEDLFRMLRAAEAREVLAQAVLDAPMFPIRWRWTASRALAILRWRGGRKVPPRLQRMEAEDLLAVVFPDQLACLENVAGDREIPDHPLVRETMRDCLEEACDAEGLTELLRRIESGAVRVVARDLREPSPLAHEILGARPYAFLDDAPLEERRTQAVQQRRFLDPQTAARLGALDAEAIERVRAEAWPEARGPDELHDALSILGFVTAAEGRAAGWEPHLAALAAAGRAAVLEPGDGARDLWVAAERLPELAAVHPGAAPQPRLAVPERFAARAWGASEALVALLRDRLSGLGPVTAARLARDAGVAAEQVGTALAALEGEGRVLRGRFSPGAAEEEWCERGLLARIHRLTLDRLRREIEPVPPADYLRFLLAWSRVAPGERARGADGLEPVLSQLEGFEAAAAAWESEILPARFEAYDPAWLDALCLSGRWVWGRAQPPGAAGRRSGPVRTTPVALVRREALADWAAASEPPEPALSPAARAVADRLRERGASFFADLAAAAGLLKSQAEEALAELVACGLATSDSFTGLRALLAPSGRRPPLAGGRRRRAVAEIGMESAGRWSLLRPATAGGRGEEPAGTVARALLRRYGVVFRRLLEREGMLPPWRDLLRALRGMEARGEVRGGRFVDGFSGEQYALPGAVGRLRAVRRQPPGGVLISVCGSDPLNLAGVLTPGERLAALPGNRVLYRDGEPIALLESGKVRLLVDLAPGLEPPARDALLRRRVPPRLRLYLGRTG
jgi:ATP-dependent Lhr-like helicase